ncbi:MAG TPA: IS1595 family transposase [Bryobacteraceae bacterium]|nr:IS1595 family transposase [Bryobacteraceae bacterium]
MEAVKQPQTLQEAIVYFSDQENCLNYLVSRRPEWKDGVVCPTCGSKKVGFLKNQLRWQCSNRHPKRQFSVKVGTIFEDSPLGLDKWLPAMWLILNCKNGVSSCEIARALDVTQKTAWFMLHRIRLAQQSRPGKKLGKSGNPIEADETYVGGKLINMHLDRQTRMRMGKRRTGGFESKAIVMGLLERHGEARVKVIPRSRAYYVRSNVVENVEKGATVYTDSLRSYRNLPVDGFVHEFIDHTESYVRDNVHTNSLENFWSLLKRSLKGTYVSVEPFHLQAYADEQCFRFNHRKATDAERFDLGVREIVGRRLTYAELTGKEGETETE